jgi:hypothetical protein
VLALQSSCFIDFAQTGFEFHKRRAVPSVEGIVVAQENADMLLDVRPFSCSRLSLKCGQAFWASEHQAIEKAFTKKQERCLKRWKMLINGLAIRNRLQSDYGKAPPKSSSPGKSKGNAKADIAKAPVPEKSQVGLFCATDVVLQCPVHGHVGRRARASGAQRRS